MLNHKCAHMEHVTPMCFCLSHDHQAFEAEICTCETLEPHVNVPKHMKIM